MGTTVELRVDATEAVGMGVDLTVAATVFLPDGPLSDPPVVAFMYPGGGYNRRYFSFTMPGSDDGGEAAFHTDRGWIVVACDSLGFGDSTTPAADNLSFENIAVGNLVVVQDVMSRLEAGALVEGLAPISNAVKLGFGQSMGGCFTIVLQGQHAPFDGVASLGYSAIHTIVPARPGTQGMAWPWFTRGASMATTLPLNAASMAAAAGPPVEGTESLAAEAAVAPEHPFAYAFHYSDEPVEVVHADLFAGLDPSVTVPEWKSLTVPSCGTYMVAPGAVALEAACITVPVLTATGEIDVVPDPWMEPKAFKSSRDITVYVCPKMAHMHNFASTRVQFWQRLQSWGDGVARSISR